MESAKTAITKLTPMKKKIDNILALSKITSRDLENLTDLERRHLGEIATEKLQHLKGEERDRFLDKMELALAGSVKSDLWEYNHNVVSQAISNYMREYGVMPLKNTIAEKTGLSRQTVAKHFKEYKAHPEFMAAMEQFKFMAPKILASVFKHATNGDMRAARLYFEMVGAINKQPSGTFVNEQNNYIQINNTKLSQEKLKQLSAEKLNLIENIITDVE